MAVLLSSGRLGMAAEAMTHGRAMVPMRTDRPSLDGAHVEQALTALDGQDAAFDPVEDGVCVDRMMSPLGRLESALDMGDVTT